MNVLILTDFTETSENAGRYAIDLFRSQPADFFLLNIHEFHSIKSRGQITRETEETLNMLKNVASRFRKYSRNNAHNFHVTVSSDGLISAVRKTLKDKKIDLIIIGAANREKHEQPILGDHAYDVVKKIKCNIIAVPSACVYGNLQNAVFPIDHGILSVNEHQDILENLNYLRSSKFTILEIKDSEQDNPVLALDRSQNGEPVPFTRNLFKDIQKKYDLILIFGKNLNICERLLHSEYGFSAKMTVEIPIFVYHA